MKMLLIIFLLISQFIIYRIAFPKKSKTKRDDDTPQKRETDISEVVVKTRFVRPENVQSPKTYTTSLSTEIQEDMPNVPAVGNEIKDAVIPPEKIDKVFADNPNPDELDIPPDDDDEPDLEDESADLQQTTDVDAGMADGLTIEEMTETIEAIADPSDGNAELLYRVEKTDMFEQLVSDDEAKAARINAIVERYVHNLYAEVEKNEETGEGTNSNEWDNFDVFSFLNSR